jgi:2',3'-cyclic-nucleotide 2'-phosphodiesterase (5'-nucleotidase family)
MTGYVQALRAWAPQARQGGAQVLVVLAHVPMDELLGTAAAVKDLGIPLMLGGHSHELGQIREPQSGTWVVHSWEWWKAYSRVDLDYDEATGRTRVERLSQVCLKQAKPEADPKVKAIVEKWRKALEKDYGKPLGFLSAPLTRPWGAGNFVTDAWLAMDPKADVAVCNQGGLRQDLKAGIVTKADLLGLMPFNDKLFHVKLTGRQLVDFLADTKEQEQRSPAGIRREGNGFVLMKTGKAVDPKAVYLLLTTDYMYDTSKALRAADPHPVKAGEDWRKLVEEWLIKHPTSKEQPLDKVVDTQPRM